MAEKALSYTERRGGAMPAPNGSGVRNALASNTWHPTVINLMILVVLEVGAYALLRYSFRQFHGG
jgi:hypothetical protein